MAKKRTKLTGKKLTEKNEKAGKKKDASGRQAEVIIGIMAGIILLIIAIMIISNLANNFKYLGLDFKRVKEGNLILYTTNINAVKPDGRRVSTGIYLRNDPRDLSEIPIEGKIRILGWNTAYVSTNPNIAGCEDNMLALTTLGIFLKSIGYDVKAGSTDGAFARQSNIEYAPCGRYPDNSVMIIQKGEENSIKQINEKCYEITFKDCEIMKVTERFMVGVIAHSMGYYGT